MTALPLGPHRRWSPPRLTQRPVIASVTPRQADVLTGICLGLSNVEIARALFVTEDTVKSHLRRLYRAIDARDRCHAVALTVSGQVVLLVRGWSQP